MTMAPDRYSRIATVTQGIAHMTDAELTDIRAAAQARYCDTLATDEDANTRAMDTITAVNTILRNRADSASTASTASTNVITWYARLSGYNGQPTQEVYAVRCARCPLWDDDTEPYFNCYTRLIPMRAGEGDTECVRTIVYYDYLYRRCAPIDADLARSLAPDLFAYVAEEEGTKVSR
jgi:hypothetical protein